MTLATSLVSIDVLRGLGTVLAFVAFIAICLWAYSRNRRADFEQAANLPFADDINANDISDAARAELHSRLASSAQKENVV